MDRLTIRWHGESVCNASAEECEKSHDNERPDDCCCGCEHQRAVYEKLYEYEAAEERGLLVRLPCKVGDKVYRIDSGDCHSNWKPYIEELTVTVVGYVREHKEVVLTIVAGGIRYKEKNFGKTVFLTREEAEQALAEKGSILDD